MQNITDEGCFLLRTSTVITNLSETTLGMPQQPRTISSIKIFHVLFHCSCLRVFFFAERQKNDANDA